MDKHLIETFTSVGVQKDIPSILLASLDIDIICCESIAQEESYSSTKSRILELIDKFTNVNKNESISKLEDFVNYKRKYFKYLILGREDFTFGTAFRGTVHSYLLYLISIKKPVVTWKREIGNYTPDLRENWFDKPRQEIIEEYVDLFRYVYKDLSADVLKQVCDMSETFFKVASHFKRILYIIYEDDTGHSIKTPMQIVCKQSISEEGIQTVTKRKEKFLDTKENKIILQCMVEYYLSVTSNSSKQTWQAFIHNSWKIYFPGIQLSNTIQNELDFLLWGGTENSSDNKKVSSNFHRYMRALGIVISNSNIQNIRSEAVLRTLVVNRTIAMTLSMIDPNKANNKEAEDVLQDISAYLSYINYVTGKAEEDDLEESIGLYLENGRFSPNFIKLIAKYSNMWKKIFLEMKEYLNSRNKAVSVLYDRIDEMETTLAKAEYNSMKKMVLYMDRGGAGFCLGKLYRFVADLDDLSIREIRTLLSCYFNMLNNIGIKPVYFDRLDTFIDEEEELFNISVPEIDDNVNGERILAYPGWSVKDSLVALPVFRIKEN